MTVRASKVEFEGDAARRRAILSKSMQGKAKRPCLCGREIMEGSTWTRHLKKCEYAYLLG
jgi:hypothetical protein